MDTKLREMILNIKDMDTLDEVFKLIKTRTTQLEMNAATSFKPGDKVQWTSKHRGNKAITGIVTKVNVTTVAAIEDSTSIRWKIASSLLKKVS